MDTELSQILLEFALLFTTISGISLLFKRFKLPIVLAPILLGIFIRYTPLAVQLDSKAFLAALDTLSNCGVLFLLFYIGLQIDTNDLKRFGRPIIKLTSYSIVLPFVFGFLLIWFKGYGLLLAIVIGLTRIPVAEAVVVPILDEFGLIDTKVGKFIIGPGILDDLIELLLVAIASIWIANQINIFSDISVLTIIFSMLIFGAMTLLGYKVFIPFLGKLVDHSPRTSMTFCIAILLFYSGLSEYSHLGLVVGALISGMVTKPWLKTLNEADSKLIINTIQLAGYGFLGIFFFYKVGLLVEPMRVIEAPFLCIGLFLAGTLGKLLSALILVQDGSLTFREGIIVGVGLDVRMTTELIIAQMLFFANIIDAHLYTALIAASSISMITVPTTLTFLLRKWGNELKA